MGAAIAYCDWMPTSRSGAFFANLGGFHQLLVESGRDPKTLSIAAYYEPTGNLDQDRRALARFAEAGVDRVSSLGAAGVPGQGVGDGRGVGTADLARYAHFRADYLAMTSIKRPVRAAGLSLL